MIDLTSGAVNCASWGEILTTAAKMRGGVGAILDGYHRDTRRVLEQQWPVFSRGAYAQDAAVRSVVVNYRCVIEIGTFRVRPGDPIFADLDGVLVIPREVEAEALERAMQKAQGENWVCVEIEGGSTSTAVSHKYRILCDRCAGAFPENGGTVMKVNDEDERHD